MPAHRQTATTRRPPAILLIGPTASGKSGAALAIDPLQLAHQRIELGIAEERLTAAVGGIGLADGLAEGLVWARFGRALGG